MSRSLTPRATKRAHNVDPVSVVVLCLAVIGGVLVFAGVILRGTSMLAMIPPIALAVWAASTLRRR